jgi:hypothetical protein
MSPASDFEPMLLSPDERAALNKRWCVVDWMALFSLLAFSSALVLSVVLP